jgi:ParB/RepB/Spo0J family partition protein
MMDDMAKDALHSEEVAAAASVDDAQAHEGAVFIGTRDIPLEQICLADNVRQTLAGVDDLAASFAAQGQLEPCRVRRLQPSSKKGMSQKGSPGEPAYQLIFGYRRHTAATKLGWPTLRCEVWQLEDGACAQQIAENKQREPLSPMEEARMMETMRASADPPLRKVEIAQALGCDPTYVVQRLKLLTKLAPAGQEAIEAGKLSVSVVEEIMRLDDEQEQEKAVKNAVRYGWSVRQTLHHVKRVQGDRAQAEASTSSVPAPGMMAAIPAPAITELPRLTVRETLSEGDVRRGLLYALLRNGMDRELLDHLAEAHQVSFEQLWLYISHLSDGQVDELSRSVLVRYLSASHRYPSLEPELRAFYGEPGKGSDDGGAPGTVPGPGSIASIDPLLRSR